MARTFERWWRDASFLVAGGVLGTVFAGRLAPTPPRIFTAVDPTEEKRASSSANRPNFTTDPEPDALRLLRAAKHSSADAWKVALAMYRAPKVDSQLAWDMTARLDSKGLSQLAAAMSAVSASRSSVDHLGSVFYRWGAVDPAAAFVQARTLSPRYRKKAQEMIMHGFIQHDPGQVCTLLAVSPSDASPSTLGEPTDPAWRRWMLGDALSGWAKQDPAAAGFYAGLPADRLADNSTWELAEDWADKDPAAALDWASHLSGRARTSAMGGGLESWAQADPTAALAYVAKLPADHNRETLEGSVIQGWVARDPVEVAKWAETLEGASAVRMLDSVAEDWARSDASATGAWAAGLTSDQAQTEVWPIVARHLALSAPDAADQWLESLPAGANQDEAIYAYCETAGPGNDPVKMYGWSQRIHDPQRRDNVAAENLSKWLEESPEAARRWIEQAKLPTSITEHVYPPQ